MEMVTLPPNTELKDYRILSVRGTDAWGNNYNAEHISLGHTVVLHEFAPPHCAGLSSSNYELMALPDQESEVEKAYEAYIAHLRMSHSLQHSAIHGVVNAFSGPTGTVYAERSVIGGVLLHDRMATADEELLHGILEQMLHALDYLYKKDLLPTELPGNCITIDKGRLKLDLFCRLRSKSVSLPAGGPPGYTALEQMLGNNPGVPAVIYSVGALFYELISGVVPVVASQRVGKHDCYVPLANQIALSEKYSKRFLSSIDKALSLWVEDRWESYEAWLSALMPSEPQVEDKQIQSTGGQGLTLGKGLTLGRVPIPKQSGSSVAEMPSENTQTAVSTPRLGRGIGLTLGNVAAVVSPVEATATPSADVETSENEKKPMLGSASGLTLGRVGGIFSTAVSMQKTVASSSSTLETAMARKDAHTAVASSSSVSTATPSLTPAPAVRKLGSGGFSLGKGGGLAQAKKDESFETPTKDEPKSEETPIDFSNLTKEHAERVLTKREIEADDYAEQLLVAAADCDEKLVRLLLAAGAAPDGDGDNYGHEHCSPLYVALFYGGDNALPIVKVLVEAGVSVDSDLGYESPLHRAICSGAVNTVKYLIDQGADVNIGFGEGGRPLHAAVDVDNTDYLELLVDAGADPEWEDEYGNTALQYAARHGKLNSLRWLVMKGANRDVKDNYGDSVLDVTTDEECRKVLSPEMDEQRQKVADLMKMICDQTGLQNPDADEDAPWTAMELTTDEKCRKALNGEAVSDSVAGFVDFDDLDEAGASERLSEMGIDQDEYAEKLLDACSDGDVDMVHLLLLAGADPEGDGESYCHDTCFPIAAAISWSGDVAVVKLLLEYGVDIDGDIGHESPLYRAVCCKDEKIVRFLLKEGADINMRHGEGGPPALAAAEVGATDILPILLKAGAELEYGDKYGNTPLLSAARYGKTKILRMLIDAGADVNACDRYGTHVLDFTTDSECINMLKEAGSSKGTL